MDNLSTSAFDLPINTLVLVLMMFIVVFRLCVVIG